MRMTGNKGEWSELYALLRILATGKLYAADKNVEKINNIFFPVVKVHREENGHCIDYIINPDRKTVDVLVETKKVKELEQSHLLRMSSYVYKSIEEAHQHAFEIDEAQQIMNELQCTRITAPSTDKADINMVIHDIHTGIDSVCGFSIKSEMGSAPTLLNASGATNFCYEASGVDDAGMDIINSINSGSKIVERIKKVYETGELKYNNLSNSTFAGNLMFIDSYMEEILADMLLDSYRTGIVDVSQLVKRLEERNPLGYPRNGLYRYKMKKLLCSFALGMMPSKRWDGMDEANGGYVIVKENGDIVAYHMYNRNEFEEYLLENTKLERGSTSRHGFASVYSKNGKKYMNLNLQIRFM